MRIHQYNTEQYSFRKELCALLKISDPEHLHLTGHAPPSIVVPGKDNHTEMHDRFYKGLSSSIFQHDYNELLQHYIRPLVGEPIVAQARPTFRIHWVGNLSVGAFHRDSDYNHNPEEVNFWIPITEAYGTNTIWLESGTNKCDFHPARVSYGQILEFRGGDLMHGNKINDTEITRVSFDFRVVPQSKYVEPAEPKAGLGFGLHKFKIGEYYKLIL